MHYKIICPIFCHFWLAFSWVVFFRANISHINLSTFMINWTCSNTLPNMPKLECPFWGWLQTNIHCWNPIFPTGYFNFITIHCDNIMGVPWVYWRIYSWGVAQYIQRREAPRDILLNPEGVYSPIHPCHTHYITIVIGKK